MTDDAGLAAPPVQVRDLTAEAADALARLAASLGFDAARVDLTGCDDKQEFLARMAGVLAFPAWFGANLDALYESLTDEDTWAIGHGAVVVLDPLPYTERFGVDERDALLDVFRDVAEHYAEAGVPFRVFYR